MTNPAASLAPIVQAEQQLAASISAAATALDAVGTSTLADALARFEQAAAGVQSRMGEALGRFNATLTALGSSMAQMAQGILAGLPAAPQAKPDAPALTQQAVGPAPVERPQGTAQQAQASEEIEKDLAPISQPTAPADDVRQPDAITSEPVPAFAIGTIATTTSHTTAPASEVAGPSTAEAVDLSPGFWSQGTPEVSTAAMPPAGKPKPRRARKSNP